MKAEELRIGNYVRMTRKDYDGSFLVVCSINKTFAECKLHNELDDDWSYKNDIWPIELTEQWLIDFGFEKEHGFEKDGIEWREDLRCICLCHGQWCQVSSPLDYDIKYVH